MSMLNIYGTLAIFEGVHRARRARKADYLGPATSAGSVGPQRVTPDSVWPDRHTRNRIRRMIEHGQRAIVVLDAEEAVFDRNTEPNPVDLNGSIRRDGADRQTREVSITPFDWLRPVDRTRGEEFASQSAITFNNRPAHLLPVLLVEDSLIGTNVPLRFAYRTAPLTIDVLCKTIDRIYQQELASNPFVAAAVSAQPLTTGDLAGLQRAS